MCRCYKWQCVGIPSHSWRQHWTPFWLHKLRDRFSVRADGQHGARPEIDIYPVGLLEDLLFLTNTVRKLGRGVKLVHLRHATTTLYRGFQRSWRRRSYWNGYLAEDPTGGSAGHGWTKRRAYKRWLTI